MLDKNDFLKFQDETKIAYYLGTTKKCKDKDIIESTIFSFSFPVITSNKHYMTFLPFASNLTKRFLRFLQLT
jgi:hypothetical protein